MESISKKLYEKLNEEVNLYSVLKLNNKQENFELNVSKEFEEEFFEFIDKLNLSIMEDNENFYGYFLFQMNRKIKFDITNSTAINFKNAKYVIYFNPFIFLNLTINQMKSSIKHEILHIISMHLIRSKNLKNNYSNLAINLAMDIVVNKYLNDLPPFAITVSKVNLDYSMNLSSYETFEYYVEEIQKAMDLMEFDEESNKENEIKTEFDASKTHDIWEFSDDLDEKTLKQFTEKFIDISNKGENISYIESLISDFKKSKDDIAWNLYLRKLYGSIQSKNKKTITRRNRRQPNRLDLKGELRNYKPQIAVAIDISGSISDEEFYQAMCEVLKIVKTNDSKITVIECDKEIKRIYKIKSKKDIKQRLKQRGATLFSPVFECLNKKSIDLLIYFTDGKGEEKLSVAPRGYKVLWVLSSRGEKLSLIKSYGNIKKLKQIEIKDNTFEMSDVRSDGYSMTNQAPII